MSSAFYPLGMNNNTNQGGYKSWKGHGTYQNPSAITSTNIRPLTNKDYGNVFPTGFGLPRPIKHYRKGTVVIPDVDVDGSNDVYSKMIQYNLNRTVKSSNGASLSGGSGGLGMVSQVIDAPALNSVQENANDSICNTYDGIKMVSSWYPIQNLTEKPQSNNTNAPLCCNQPRNARKRVLGANTNVKKNYYQTSHMYLYNRCQTFKQREFNFLNGPVNPKVLELINDNPSIAYKLLMYAKPGDSLTIYNQYVAQCTPNSTINATIELDFIQIMGYELYNEGQITDEQYEEIMQINDVTEFLNYIQNILDEKIYFLIVNKLENISRSSIRGCSQVYYKPNNPQFAKQGAVSCSSKILKLNVDTLSSSAYTNKNNIHKNKVSNTESQCVKEQVMNILKSYRQLGLK